MKAQPQLVASWVVLLWVVVGCVPTEPKYPGEKGGQCLRGGVCALGLTCVYDTCVDLPGPDAGVGPADAGSNNDAGAVVDAGTMNDAGMSPDASVQYDAGAATDAGSPTDAGVREDAGDYPDGGTTQDAGITADGGTTQDAGITADGGSTQDAGTTADGGTTQDAGTTADGGTTQDAGITADAGPALDAGASQDGGVIDAGPGQEALSLPEGMTLVPMLAGSFTMGSPANEVGRIDGSEHQRVVTLTRKFAITTTEITQGQWKALTGFEDPSRFQNCGDDCPVEKVDFYAAVAYANALSAHAGLSQCYTLSDCDDGANGWQDGQHTGCTDVVFAGLDCSGFRLPTEAEWEYAYRSGTTTAYYNGNDSVEDCELNAKLDAIGWYCHNAAGKTHAVAQKTANPAGLFDMAGNVWEWTWDYYSNENPGNGTDPMGPTSGFGRVVRGGSWFNSAAQARAASRLLVMPNNADDIYGLRLVRTLP